MLLSLGHALALRPWHTSHPACVPVSLDPCRLGAAPSSVTLLVRPWAPDRPGPVGVSMWPFSHSQLPLAHRRLPVIVALELDLHRPVSGRGHTSRDASVDDTTLIHRPPARQRLDPGPE